MTTTVAERADPRTLTEDELADLYGSRDDDTCAAVLAEITRRNRADRARDKRRAVESEWYDSAFAGYLAAEAATNGYMLSREGEASGLADAFGLWRMPERQALRFASEELREHWLTHPRISLAEYRRQLSTARRVGRDDRDKAAMDAMPEPEPEQEPEWERCPGGAVKPASVALGAATVAAWAAMGPAGAITLHPTESQARAFLAPEPEPEPPLAAPDFTGTAAENLAAAGRFCAALAERGARRSERMANLLARAQALTVNHNRK